MTARRSWLPAGFEFISGLPEGQRRRSLILTLQAYFDDSGGKGQGRWMAMSGLLGEAEVFASLADQWRLNLAGPYPPGRIHYFKMDEAVQFKGEFRDWNEQNRDMKVKQLAKLLDRGDLLQVGSLLDFNAYEKYAPQWRHIRAQKGDAQRFHTMDQPYLMLFQSVFTMAIAEAVDRGATTPIDVIFDQHDLFRESIMAAYPGYREEYKSDPKEYAVVPNYPMFRDDQVFLPLQGADLVAGEMRLAAEDYADNPSFIGDLCPNLRVSRFFTVIGERHMKELHEHLRQSAERDEIEITPPVDDLDCL